MQHTDRITFLNCVNCVIPKRASISSLSLFFFSPQLRVFSPMPSQVGALQHSFRPLEPSVSCVDTTVNNHDDSTSATEPSNYSRARHCPAMNFSMTSQRSPPPGCHGNKWKALSIDVTGATRDCAPETNLTSGEKKNPKRRTYQSLNPLLFTTSLSHSNPFLN